jgi:peptide deformylase
MILMPVDLQSLTLQVYPASILKERAQEVDPTDESVQAVARRMISLMFEHHGVGLAAPQVGLSWRLFVTRHPKDPDNEESGVAWINPVLEVLDGTIDTDEEGCLSIPDVRGNIKRPLGIRISGNDANGLPTSQESDEFIARIWQHENDHIDGVLIIDKMSAMDRLVNRKLIRDLERQQ